MGQHHPKGLNKVTAKLEDHNGLETVTVDAMSTSFFIAVNNCMTANWKEIIVDWIKYVEREWSRFNSGNELSRLNQLKAGEEAAVSPPLFDLLLIAEAYRNKTNGYFSPYLLPQMEFHGYTRSFPFLTSTHVTEQIPAVHPLGTSPLSLTKHTSVVKHLSDCQLDLGGIAKGYAVQAAANWLKINGAAAGVVDGGGDMAVWSTGEKEWKISIAHPYQTELDIAQFRIKNGAIATSNIIYRKWHQGEKEKHHLLNGVTGQPVENGIIQATAISETCPDAEVIAKLAFMASGRELEQMAKKIHPNYSLVTVTKDGKIIFIGGDIH